jgi:hypothetical protein
MPTNVIQGSVSGDDARNLSGIKAKLDADWSHGGPHLMERTLKWPESSVKFDAVFEPKLESTGMSSS